MSFNKIFVARNDRIYIKLRKQVAKISKMEPAFEAFSDDELEQRVP